MNAHYNTSNKKPKKANTFTESISYFMRQKKFEHTLKSMRKSENKPLDLLDMLEDNGKFEGNVKYYSYKDINMFKKRQSIDEKANSSNILDSLNKITTFSVGLVNRNEVHNN